MNNPINVVSNFEQTLLSNSGDDAFEVAFYLFSIKLLDEIEIQEGKGETEFIDQGDVNLTLLKNKVLEGKVKKRWPDLGVSSESFSISDEHMYRVILSLHSFKLIDTDLSIVDAILERLSSHTSKSSLGQYFTPREVIKMCVEIIDPKSEQTIIDPACGSSGFLFESTMHSLSKNEKAPTCLGMDISIKSIRVAYLMRLVKDLNNIELVNVNSLDSCIFNESISKLSKKNWAACKKNEVSLENIEADIIFANPPFAGNIENELLNQYDLAKNKSSVSRDVLFIEKCIKLLRKNGRMAIVIPNGILSNSGYKYVREWIASEVKIIAVIGLDSNAFMPYTSVKTSILILEKSKPKRNDTILFTCSFNSGHDSSGRNVYENDYKKLTNEIKFALNPDVFSREKNINHPLRRIKLVDVLCKNRMDAEYYISDVQDNLSKLGKLSESKISDVARGTHKKFNKKIYDSVRYVDISSIETKFGYAFPNLLKIKDTPGRASYLLQKGDVLISTVRPERNTVALVNQELDEPMIASNGFCVLRPEKINPYYLYAYCKSDVFKNILSGLSTSSMYPTVSDKEILNMPITYPDFKTKKLIEDKVESSFIKIKEAQDEIKEAIEMMNEFLRDELN